MSGLLVSMHVCMYVQYTGMCPDLGERWLHKEILSLPNLVILKNYAQIVSRIPCRHFISCKVTSKTKHFHSSRYFNTSQ